MTRTAILPRYLLIATLPLSIVFISVFLAQSVYFQKYPHELSIGITVDLVLTLPIVYFLLIRKKEMPKFTVASVFIAGIVLAGLIIPTEHQAFLVLVKTWAVPIIEIGILSVLIYHIRNTLIAYKQEKNKTADFFTAINAACQSVLPTRVGKVMAMEIAVLYYLFTWPSKPTLKENEFTNHRKSGTTTVLWVFIGLILSETFVVHILLEKWNTTAAWVLSFLSLYTCLQIIALIKSMGRRPVICDLNHKKLHLRYGFFSETIIDFKNIKSIELNARSLPADKSVLSFSPFNLLDTHNIIIHLHEKDKLHGFYGSTKNYKSLAIYIDDKKGFMEKITKEVI